MDAQRNVNVRLSYLQRKGLQHRDVRIIVSDDLIPRLITAPDVKTSALIRYQLQMWLDNYRVEIFDSTVLLKQARWCALSSD